MHAIFSDDASRPASPMPESPSHEPSKNQDEIRDLTNTPDLDEPIIDDHNISIEPTEPEPRLEPEPKPISNEPIATQSQKDLAISKVVEAFNEEHQTRRNSSEEIETRQNVSETIVHVEKPIFGSKTIKNIPTTVASKELLENLERGHENIETLGYIDVSALENQKSNSPKNQAKNQPTLRRSTRTRKPKFEPQTFTKQKPILPKVSESDFTKKSEKSTDFTKKSASTSEKSPSPVLIVPKPSENSASKVTKSDLTKKSEKSTDFTKKSAPATSKKSKAKIAPLIIDPTKDDPKTHL